MAQTCNKIRRVSGKSSRRRAKCLMWFSSESFWQNLTHSFWPLTQMGAPVNLYLHLVNFLQLSSDFCRFSRHHLRPWSVAPDVERFDPRGRDLDLCWAPVDLSCNAAASLERNARGLLTYSWEQHCRPSWVNTGRRMLREGWSRMTWLSPALYSPTTKPGSPRKYCATLSFAPWGQIC